jgi:plasmid stabilization system protein ParE
MTTGYALHPEARADLDQIWEYIAADNIDAAHRVIDDILAAIWELSLSAFRSPTYSH